MKKIFTIFILLMATISTISAQVVINEIMYNSPDAGQDSTEYIELFNNSGVTVDLSGYSFSQGVVYVFPGGVSIPGNGFLLISNDSLAMMASYGVSSRQWTSGGLSNGGEDIEILDASMAVVDYVDYDDSSPWPFEADGSGPSLELCSPDKDNSDATFWQAATNNTGAIFEGTPVLGTPGAANTATCPAADHLVAVSSNIFTPANLTIFVGESVQWNNTGGFHNVEGSQDFFPNNPESFGSGVASGDLWEYTFTFTIPGTYDYRCTPHVTLGMVGTVTVIPIPTNDIVISEILYDIPGGDNNFEFIELTNIGIDPINLEGYTFVQGVEFTFPSMMIQPGEYLVLAEDASAFTAIFGIPAISWTSGGLSDTGEEIRLLDGAGNLIDLVNYDNNNGWPEIAAGEGPSLIVCDPSSDNSVPESWSFSTTSTGVVSGGSGNTIYATPGAANDFCSDSPYIFLENGLEDVDEDAGVATFRILLANTADNQGGEVTLNIMGSSTATDGFDYILNGSIVTFAAAGANGVSEGTFSITVLDDTDIEGSETIVLTLSNPTNGIILASPANELKITIVDNDGIDPGLYPLREIQDVTTTNTLGQVDSFGLDCEVRGIVYGINLRPSGLLFTIVDKNDNDDGIAVFSNNNFGYTVNEGDEVSVIGSISQFRGLQQINADSVTLLSSDNALFDPEFTSSLGETEESKLIRINDLTVTDFNATASGENYTVTNGTTSFIMRIDVNNELFGTTLPASFDAIGLGGQFDSDNAVPFDDGYQFLPRYAADIISSVNTVDLSLANEITILPNPVNSELFIKTELQLDEVLISNTLGQTVIRVDGSLAGNGINVSQYAVGVYHITFVVADRIWTTKFVKQ